MPELSTPVVFILYNRPDLTYQVFAAIRATRPERLFLIADGPRPDRADDPALCAAARAVVAGVDWPCRVERNYADTNLGCGYRVASGLDWVFEQVEEAIILEDDILPDPSFFSFCQALLARYRDDEQVMAIGGRNVMGKWENEGAGYLFHRHPAIWGWATWRRAWRLFDITLERYRHWDIAERLRSHMPDPEQVALKIALFERHVGRPVDTWDIHWSLICLLNHGLWISPVGKLTSNIGFDNRATHTTNALDLRRHIPRSTLPLPLIHPAGKPSQRVDDRFDRWMFLLEMMNSFRDVRSLRVWLRALDGHPDLSMPGLFAGGRHTLAPLRHPDEALAVLDHLNPLMPDAPRMVALRAEFQAVVQRV